MCKRKFGDINIRLFIFFLCFVLSFTSNSNHSKCTCSRYIRIKVVISSQHLTGQFKQLSLIDTPEIFRWLQRDTNPGPMRCRCNALPTELFVSVKDSMNEMNLYLKYGLPNVENHFTPSSITRTSNIHLFPSWRYIIDSWDEPSITGKCVLVINPHSVICCLE